MTEKDILEQLQQKGLVEIIELIEDAKSGDLEELELVESIGLVHGAELNKAVISLLENLGVKMIYVTFDEQDDDGEE